MGFLNDDVERFGQLVGIRVEDERVIGVKNFIEGGIFFLSAFDEVLSCVIAEFMVDIIPHGRHDYDKQIWA